MSQVASTASSIAIAVYGSHSQADDAVRSLHRAGFDMKKISIVGKDFQTDEHPLGYFNTGDRVKFFGKLGAFWGGLTGLLFGSALLFIPVVGHVIVLGPLAATLFGGVEGAVLGGGASALVGALTSIGIPNDSVVRYETALKAGKFLLLLDADEKEVERAHALLGGVDLNSFDHHESA